VRGCDPARSGHNESTATEGRRDICNEGYGYRKCGRMEVSLGVDGESFKGSCDKERRDEWERREGAGRKIELVRLVHVWCVVSCDVV
jgi:hypothetical protein